MALISNAQPSLAGNTDNNQVQLSFDKISINIKPINKCDVNGQFGNFRIKNSFPTNYEFCVAGIGSTEFIFQTEDHSIASLLINYHVNKISLTLSLDNLFTSEKELPSFEILSFRAGSFFIPEINYVQGTPRILKLGATINF